MATILQANTDLVAMVWLSESFPSSMIGTTLPEDNSSWAASGFVQVTAMGGRADSLVGMISPIVAVDCWAVQLTSNKAPWGKSNNMAETIRHAALLARPHALTLPGNYPKARFFTAYLVTEPRRIPDPSSYARYNFNLQLNWAPVMI